MPVDLGAKALFKSKDLAEYWCNIYAATKYSNVRADYLNVRAADDQF